MRGFRNVRVLLVGLLFTMCLGGGCNASAAGEPAEGADHAPRLFGATYMTMNNPYFEVLNDSLKDVIESNGDILMARDPAQDQQKQNAQIQEMIDEGVCAVFLNPVDWQGVRPALEACHKAGVHVFNIDTLVHDTQYVVSVIESDNYGAGVLCAEDMMRRREQAEIVILNNPVTRSITQRAQGFLDTIAPYRDRYRVIHTAAAGGELEVSLDVMGRILEAGYAPDVVLGGNDPTALGALAALQQHHREQGVLIYGIDGSPDFKAMLRDGYTQGTSSQSPKTIGTVAAETAYRFLAGEKVPAYISIPVTLITRDNLDEYEITGWQ